MINTLLFFVISFNSFIYPSLIDESILKIPKVVGKQIIIDGIVEDDEWPDGQKVELITPWDDSEEEATIFKCCYTDLYFNFAFNVIDSTLTVFDFEDELTVAKEDRVELFFSKDSILSDYYCIEIDPLGRILDYSAKYYRKFDEGFDFKTVDVAIQFNENGYTAEGRILKNELKALGIETEFYLGIFRADYKSTRDNDVTWYSFIKPDSKNPDFHIPSAFKRVSAY
jgi:chondroitin AC lyase